MLAMALNEAERANLAKTAFLSNMSYEIRTPMNAIVSLYNIALRREGLDNETRELLTQIGTNARHLLHLINDILDMSLIESGHVKLKNDEFSLASLLEQINTLTETQCDDKGLSFDCALLGHLEDYYIGDDLKLKQLLFSILENAVKYTPAPGKVSLRIEEVSRHEGKALVRFAISDTGPGIDDNYLARIFEPFVKEEEGINNRFGSTGLGLAIAKNIADMMGGTITVDNEKGKGTTFTVTLSLGVSGTKGGGRYSFDPKSLRALIVDDDVTSCEHAKMVLKRIGIESDYVLSGEEALSMFENDSFAPPFNLVLADWKMPGMDGIELTRRIRENADSADITIILTTYNWYEVMEEALVAGVDAFLAKPLFASSTGEEIGKILAERSMDQQRQVKKTGLSGRRVLLAEDMEINAQIMKQVLRLKDMETDIAKNGREALDMFNNSEEWHYDAILMDIRMPVLSGLDAAKRIRGLERDDARSVPIIALTANAFDEDIKLSLEAGMNAHLCKPVEPDALFATLSKYITEQVRTLGPSV